MTKHLKKFFWLCSGAHIETLEKCPTEGTKYVGIGATIFFTGIFAALAGAYALFTVFDTVWAAFGFGILWGLMIFNLDRYIVSSMRKRDSPAKELLMAAPRIVLAVFISIVIAKPLEIKIFEKEINTELAVMQQEEIKRQEDHVTLKHQGERERLTLEIENLKAETDTKAAKRDELRKIAQQEADGTGGTKKRNAGPIYKIKKADADRVEQELIDLKSRNDKLIQNKIVMQDSLNTRIATELAAMDQVVLGGMASRIEALDRLESKSNAIFWASTFIMILFIAIESAPVLVKLMSPKGPYDHLIFTDHYSYKAQQYEASAKMNNHIKKRCEKLSEYEREYLEERLNLSLDKS